LAEGLVVDGPIDLRQTELVREAFAHDVVLSMESEADVRAPGAAITVALCGDWEHEPPCPVAPHYTSAERVGGDVHVRTLFVVQPAGEAEVRQRIRAALADGELVGPDGEVTCWQVRSSHPSAVLPEEGEHAERLARS
jgi:hypothetical protein